MMNIQNDQLIFRDKMMDARIFSLMIIALGLLLFFAIGSKGFPMLIFTVAGLSILLLASDLTITADRSSQTLRLTYASIVKHSVKEIPFAEIADISLQQSNVRKKHRIRTVSRIIVTLKNGEVIPFRPEFSRASSEKERQVHALRAFIGLDWPFGAGFPDES